MPKVNLSELPKSGDKFWKHADVNKIDMSKRKPKKCEHHFIHRTSREVECKKCHIGFFLSKGWHIKNRHVYYGDKLVV